MQIDDPLYLEVTIAGKLTFIAVIDQDDDPQVFAESLAKITGKSVDWETKNSLTE